MGEMETDGTTNLIGLQTGRTMNSQQGGQLIEYGTSNAEPTYHEREGVIEYQMKEVSASSSGCFFSVQKDIGGILWHLLGFRQKSSQWFSLDLCPHYQFVEKICHSTWACTFSADITLHSSRKPSIRKFCTHICDIRKVDQLICRIAKWSEITNEQNGFLVNGCLSLTVHVKLVSTVGMLPKCVSVFTPNACSDVTFVVEGKDVCVNRAVLGLHYPIFRVLFDIDKSERIDLPNMAYDEFIEFLRTIYPERVAISPDHTRRLLLSVSCAACERVLRYYSETVMDGGSNDGNDGNQNDVAQPTRTAFELFYDIFSNTLNDGDVSTMDHEFAYDFPQYSDVTLVVEGKEIHANRAMLAIHCRYFFMMFYRDFKEQREDRVELKSFAYDEFIVFLNLLYRGFCLVDKNNVEYLLKMADFYDCATVLHECAKFLFSTRDMPIEDILYYADVYQMAHVIHKVLQKRVAGRRASMEIAPKFHMLSTPLRQFLHLF